MEKLLLIDCSGPRAILGVSKGTNLLASLENEIANTHAEFVQVGIEELLLKQNMKMQDIDAIVVTVGPGSYTGLRVAMASAKGIAYAIDKPIIGLSSLELLAFAAKNKLIAHKEEGNFHFFPMLDARRMEVFGALYNQALEIVIPEQALLLDHLTELNWDLSMPIICLGSGSEKAKALLPYPNIRFDDSQYNALDMSILAHKKYINNAFEDLAYLKPNYLKEVFIIPKKE